LTPSEGYRLRGAVLYFVEPLDFCGGEAIVIRSPALDYVARATALHVLDDFETELVLPVSDVQLLSAVQSQASTFDVSPRLDCIRLT
jgi:hypothetical protein